jgi:hypothetical protein
VIKKVVVDTTTCKPSKPACKYTRCTQAIFSRNRTLNLNWIFRDIEFGGSIDTGFRDISRNTGIAGIIGDLIHVPKNK